MTQPDLEIKCGFISGLYEIVAAELSRYPELRVTQQTDTCVYCDFRKDFLKLAELRSVWRIFIVARGIEYTPKYLSSHKSVIGRLIETVMEGRENEFQTFSIACAGADSPEVRSIAHYIQQSYKLVEQPEADLKVHIIKTENGIWEVGVQVTRRPLSVRDYKARTMPGAMDPTIAYAANELAGLESARTYMNMFAGSGTLLIEAGLCYSHLERLVGLESEKDHTLIALENVKKAGLAKRVAWQEGDVCDEPDLGTFDRVTADLPFGMSVGAAQDIETLYRCFVRYCEKILHEQGVMVAYTTEYDLLESMLADSPLSIQKTLPLALITNENAYIHPVIAVCGF